MTANIAIKVSPTERAANHVAEYIGAWCGRPVHVERFRDFLLMGFQFDGTADEDAEVWLKATVDYTRSICASQPDFADVRRIKRPVEVPTVVTAEAVTRVLGRHERAQQQQAELDQFEAQRQQVLEDPSLAKLYDLSDGEKTAARFVYKLARDLNRVPSLPEAQDAWEGSGLPLITPMPVSGWEAVLKHAVKNCKKTFKPSHTTGYDFGSFVQRLKDIIPEDALAVDAKQVKKDGSARQGEKRKSIRVTYADLDIALICATLSISGKDRTNPSMYGSVSANQIIAFFKATKAKTGRGCNKDKAVLLVKLLTQFSFVTVAKHHYTFANNRNDRKLYKLGVSHPGFTDFVDDIWQLI